MTPCPNEAKLVQFVDGALSLDESERMTEHVAGCVLCRRHDQALRTLIADVHADEDLELDVKTHVRVVMGRLETGPPAAGERPFAWGAPAWSRWLAAAVAAGAVTLPVHHALRSGHGSEELQARGSAISPTLGRDVGVQAYALRQGLEPLSSGAIVDGATPLTAGYRNVGRRPAFLLMFAVDAAGVVHWISPPYVSPQDDPVSTTLLRTADERVLGTTAVFDDLAAGPLRIVAVITPSPAHVSDVETLGADVTPGRLARRLPGAEVRETLLEVRNAGAARP